MMMSAVRKGDEGRPFGGGYGKPGKLKQEFTCELEIM